MGKKSSNIKILPSGVAVLENDSHVSRWVEQTGSLCHDGTVELFILKHIPEGGTAIDAGAFIGDHTVKYLEKVGPTGKVIAFEPNPDAFWCLKHNCPNADSHNVALGRNQSKARLNINSNAGASNIDPDGVEIDVMPLDAYNIRRVDFIKVDVEGFERELLHGAVSTIMRCRPTMIFELCDGHLKRHGASAIELVETIEALGYGVESLCGHSFDEPQLDILCIPLK